MTEEMNEIEEQLAQAAVHLAKAERNNKIAMNLAFIALGLAGLAILLKFVG